MIRKIIQINEAACNGCGACAEACHEGAIGMADGKARLLRDDYCDGLGDCLPVCPTGAIAIVKRETAEHAAAIPSNAPLPCGCPGAREGQIRRPLPAPEGEPAEAGRLAPWPVQIQLVPVRAPFFDGANLLVAADCAAYAYGDFHARFLRNRVIVIGCPKLDRVDYAEKLGAILRENDVKSLTIVRMEVPCCGGLERAATAALQASGKFIPWQTAVISTDGRLLDV